MCVCVCVKKIKPDVQYIMVYSFSHSNKQLLAGK